MNISYKWLRELSGTSLAPRELAERLTMVGLAVEAVHEAAGNDFVLDIDLTSDRPDCLSHLGVAREVAVIDNGAVILPQANVTRTGERIETLASVEVHEAMLCPRYAARVVRGVKIAASPEWLVKRLEAIGQRAINNVADITNYVLHEQGQPLHAFDFAKLIEQRIIVRRAEAGEKIKTLDGTERELDAEMLVIADASRAVAVAGVMGGEATEISSETSDVLIESAYFDPASVRRTSRLLGLHTEASHRFERGIDYDGVMRALDRCVAFICDIAGGTATIDSIDVYPQKIKQPVVRLRPSRVKTLTGLDVELSEMMRILAALGFIEQASEKENGATNPSVENYSAGSIQQVTTGKALNFVAPTWRVDIEREEDLVEEIARHVGYEKIATMLPSATHAGEYQPNEKRKRRMRNALAASGYDEAISYSFIDAGTDERFAVVPNFVRDGGGGEDRFVTLRNSIIEGATRMRPSLLPGLLQAVRHNFNYGTRDVRLFETGRIFAAQHDDSLGELPLERESLALVAVGTATQAARVGTARELDFFDLKGVLEIVADALKCEALGFHAARVKHLREGQAASISLPDKTIIGSIGRLDETIAGLYKIRQPLYVAELDLTALLNGAEVNAVYRTLARYPSIVRDVTFSIARQITFAEMLQAISGEHVENCRDVRFVNEYEGANVPANERRVTLRFEYRADERTLFDEEVNEMHGRVLEVLERKTGARVPQA
ncbi:MAG: phenylalanine--tRNA ligase subunit beta [Pyrinomonadaceae bacterium]